MQRSFKILLGLFLGLIISFNASAWWGGGPWNNGGWGYGYNPWPVWTPMYWAEEMADEWGGNDYWGGPWNYGGYPYGGYSPWGYGGGYPYGGYSPYGYNAYPYYGVPYMPVPPAP